MSMRAVELVIQGYDKNRKDSWEQTREIVFYTARPYLEGNPSKTSFMPLQWDNEKKEQQTNKSSEERFKLLESKLTKIVNNG